jgi:hypothetical protein
MSGNPVRGQAKGSATAAFATATARGAQRPDYTRDYLVTLYEDAAARGIDADVLVAQWSLETGDDTSETSLAFCLAQMPVNCPLPNRP